MSFACRVRVRLLVALLATRDLERRFVMGPVAGCTRLVTVTHHRRGILHKGPMGRRSLWVLGGVTALTLITPDRLVDTEAVAIEAGWHRQGALLMQRCVRVIVA